jgi:hypothetical protein
MKDLLVRNESGEVVGKYRQHNEPNVPDRLTVSELNGGESLGDYEVVEWWDKR